MQKPSTLNRNHICVEIRGKNTVLGSEFPQRGENENTKDTITEPVLKPLSMCKWDIIPKAIGLLLVFKDNCMANVWSRRKLFACLYRKQFKSSPYQMLKEVFWKS